jgi:hypothetical protein
MLEEILRLLAIEGVKPSDADDIMLAEIAEELDLSIDEVRRFIAEGSRERSETAR